MKQRIRLVSFLLLGGAWPVGALGAQAAAGVKYLQDLAPAGRPQMMIQARTLNNATYSHSLSFPAGEVAYPLPRGEYARFIAVVGVQEHADRAVSVTFTVKGVDQNRVTRVLHPGATLRSGESERVEVPVSDLQQLRLQVRCTGLSGRDNRNGVAWWGDARLVRGDDSRGEKMLPDLSALLDELARRFVPPAGAADERPTAAIAPFDLLPGTGEALAAVNAINVCADLQIALINARAYRVTSHGEQLVQITKQNNLQLGSNYDARTRAQLGQLLGAKNLVMGEISDRDEGGYVTTACLLDLETGLYRLADQVLAAPSRDNRPGRSAALHPSGPHSNLRREIENTLDDLKHLFDRRRPRGSNAAPSAPGGSAASQAPPARLLPFLRAEIAGLAAQVSEEAAHDPQFQREKPIVAIGTFQLVEAPNNPLAPVNARNTTTDFRVALLHTGAFEIAATGEVLDQLLLRQNTEIGREFNKETRAELGLQTGAKYLLVGEIADRTNGEYVVRVYLHDLTTGEIRIAKKVTARDRKR